MSRVYQDHIQEIGQQQVVMKTDNRPCAEWNWFAQGQPSTHWKLTHDHYSKVMHMEGGIIKP